MDRSFGSKVLGFTGLGSSSGRVLGYPVWSRDKECRAKSPAAGSIQRQHSKGSCEKLGKGHERCQDRAPAAEGGQVAGLE